MRDVERVRARGRGWWGRRLGVELVTRETTREDAAGTRSETARSYDVVCDDAGVGRRAFASPAAREEFLAASFSRLSLEAVEPPQQRVLAHRLAAHVGAEVAMVTVSHAFVAIELGGTPVTLHDWPRVVREGGALSRGDPGYGDALLARVGTRLTGVDELLDLGLVLDFSDAARLALPPGALDPDSGE